MFEGVVVICVLLLIFSIFLIMKIKDLKNINHIENLNKDEKILYLENISSELKVENLELREIKSKNEIELGILTTKLDEQTKSLEEKIELLQNSKSELTNQFKNLATEIFESNNKKFSEQNKEFMGSMLTPVKQQLDDFKKKVEDVYDKESKDRTILQHEIKSLKELNLKISSDAINLTNALKGESKTQGIWGEMILEKVLEASGLRVNHEYFQEVSLDDEDGKRFRPDVVVKLPNERDIIIDSKTSLRAYEQYINANEEDRIKYITMHVNAIIEHIKALSNKNYEKLKGVNSLDFIFMFIPIEGALLSALEHKPEIYDDAFKKHIVLVSPTTLLVALKAVENSWRYEKQAQNIVEITKRAENLYNKFYAFIKDLDDVGKALENADKKYRDAYNKLYDGKGNIIRQIELFREKANINPKNRISEELGSLAIENS